MTGTLQNRPSEAITVSALVAQPTVSLPAAIVKSGAAAEFAWDEFFTAGIPNSYTRKAYSHAVRKFFAWLEPHGVAIAQITPGMVGRYFDQHPGSPPSKKLALAAIRGLFDAMVRRHAMMLNPASSVRGERYSVIEGKTPEITIEQARRLVASISTNTVVGLRDRAIIGVLIYTAARAGAVAKLRVRHFTYDGTQWMLRFEEKGGKSREIPVRHDLQKFILEYLPEDALKALPRDLPLFATISRQTKQLTQQAVTGGDIWRMVKRRLKDAGLPNRLSPHSFRVTTVTDLLTQGVPLEDVQFLAGHADPRTTRLYDRRQKKVTRNTVEKISI
jgi:integrase/recombinase XerD